MSSASSPRSLSNKVAIVTGASRGIGAGIALEFAKRGAKVVITYTSDSSSGLAEELVLKIKELGNGSDAIKVQADLRKVESPDKIVEATRSAFGDQIDILVNNAGAAHIKSIIESTAEDFDWIFHLNVRAVFLMTKAVLPHLRAPGRIINIGSIFGRQGWANTFSYASAKAAVEGLTRCFAAELGPAGHSVNCISSGPVKTDIIELLPPGLLDHLVSLTPLQTRIGTADDIAQIVAFLAEEGSRWLTGQTIAVAGGLLML